MIKKIINFLKKGMRVKIEIKQGVPYVVIEKSFQLSAKWFEFGRIRMKSITEMNELQKVLQKSFNSKEQFYIGRN